MGREILITPNRSTTGSTLEPTISFSGATNGTINLKVEDDGSLVFEGVNGGLFNITDSKSGLLHSVNDVSGLPILSVYSDDRVIAGAYNQNALVVNSDKVGIGIPNPSEKLHVSGITIVNSDYLMLSDTLTTIPALNFKGFVNVQDSDNSIGYFGFNLNTSGETGLFIYNNSVVGGGIQTFGSNHIRGSGPHVVGSDFYRNKILISANNSSDGMVIKPKADDPLATLWFEMDTASVMILKGDGTPGGGNAFLGIALNPDGTEMPSSNLQIGGTGTTGTFKYRDGNQQSGYVLTSDLDGNATWQPSFGGNPSPYIFSSPEISIIPISGNNTTYSYGSIILGGTGNTVNSGSSYSTLVNGRLNSITNCSYSLVNGDSNTLLGNSNFSLVFGTLNGIANAGIESTIFGTSNIINGSRGNFIAGNDNRIQQTVSTGLERNHIIMGSNSVISGISDTVIILGSNITGNSSNTVYVPTLNIDTIPTVNTTGADILVRNTSTGNVESADYDNRLMFIARKYNNINSPTPNPLVSIPSIPVSSGCTYLGLPPCADAITLTNFEVSKNAPGTLPTLGGMNATTGIWTVPSSGYYMINTYAFIRANNSSNNSDIETGDFGNGYFTFGLIGVGAPYTQGLSMIVSPTTLSYISGATADSGSTSVGRTSFINVWDHKISYLTSGAQYEMKVLNNTELDYTPEAYGGSGPHQGMGFQIIKLDL